MKGARTLILGLDGATWNVADPLISEGKLPNLAKLKAEGTWSWLNSTTPPMTLPSWSSMLTGCNPGKHGIFDFVHYQEGSLQFVNASHRCVPTIHQILSQRGARVASLLVPTTWPPQKINGVMVSGFDSPVATGVDGSFCFPNGLYKEIEKRFGGVYFADIQETNIHDSWHEDALKKLLREIKRKCAIARWLLKQERWDCFMLLFGESDTVSHHFWMFCDPASPRFRYDPALSQAINQVYMELDRVVGELIEVSQPSWVCICSDHGFGGAGTHVLYLNRFLEHHGWLKSQKESRLSFLRMKLARHLPHKILDKSFRSIPSFLRDRLETRARYGGIEMSQTRAFSDEMNYSATIRMPSRVGLGTLRAHLLSWKVDGHHPIRSVEERENLYHGEATNRSPELILTLNEREGYTYTLLPSSLTDKDTLWRELAPHEYVGGKGLGMNGSHRQHGVLCMYGEGVDSQQVPANMEDIAPTLLALMGESIPAHMDGEVCVRGCSFQKVDEQYSHMMMEPTKARDSLAIRKRLQKLGYL